MKKIAILTRRAGYNMGSSLQAFAMSRFIKDAGYDNIIINYDEYSAHFTWRIRPAINSFLYRLFHILPQNYRNNLNKYQILQNANEQITKFNEFEQNFMPLTDKIYKDQNSLSKDFFDYDSCICGSDQIWNPEFLDPTFFLRFIDSRSKCKKIAYAPSITVKSKDSISKQQCQWMGDFDSLSCREGEGAELISQCTGKHVSTVLDPTLMVDTQVWYRMAENAKSAINDEYILTYFLNDKTNIGFKVSEFIAELKEITGLPVYNINLFNLINFTGADHQLMATGPVNFLSLLKNASYVCTNSYHATIFSYIFRKNLFIFKRFNKGLGVDQNSRFFQLNKLLDIEKLFVDNNTSPDLNMIQNFTWSDKKIAEAKSLSLEYLHKSINN